MNVSAVIVTRGDVDLSQIVNSFPPKWEIIVWDNSCESQPPQWWKDMEPTRHVVFCGAEDMAIYGRYAAINYASHDLIYVQDDDCVVSDPQEIVMEWMRTEGANRTTTLYSHVVCNMPPEFRHEFYEDHALVGFGAAFHRNAPKEAFASFWTAVTLGEIKPQNTDFFNRTCDIIFTALTPRVLVDIEYENLPWASADNRMWKQPCHQKIRNKALKLALEIR